MLIGILKEIKSLENRVSATPSSVGAFVKNDHEVWVQKGAGLGSGYPDGDYVAAGAKIVNTAQEIYASAQMVMKVKEPQPVEYPWLREGQIIFTFFHFASSKELTDAVIRSKCTAIAYETITDKEGRLPLLVPMSEVAGRLAVQMGSYLLQQPSGGIGALLGSVTGVEPRNVLILGGGAAGANAALMAGGLGANVTILDVNLSRIRYLKEIMPANVHPLMSSESLLRERLKKADLVINSILIPGAIAPKVVTREMLKTMQKGAVVIDISIDQGGGFETSRPTSHENPTYVEEGIIHYCVTNMPGAVPVTSTQALTNATFPYALEIANTGCECLRTNRHIAAGANVVGGLITYQAVADAFGYDYTPLEEVLAQAKVCR